VQSSRVAGRTFLDLPGRDIALGHGRRKCRHVEVLRRERSLASMESYVAVNTARVNPDRETAHLSVRHDCRVAGSQCAPTPYTPQQLKPSKPVGEKGAVALLGVHDR
jgi:hypothetical protein